MVEPEKKDMPYRVEPTTASWWDRFYFDRKSLVLTWPASSELFSDAKFNCAVCLHKDAYDLQIERELKFLQSKIDESMKGNKIYCSNQLSPLPH